MATDNQPNEWAPRQKRSLRLLWMKRRITAFQKIMLWLGWVPADITRTLNCAWCNNVFTVTVETAADSPRYCSKTHRNKASKARTARLQAAADSQPREIHAQCRCHGHTGKPKVKYLSNATATNGLLTRHLGYGRIYQCPTSSYWHITTQMERKVAS